MSETKQKSVNAFRNLADTVTVQWDKQSTVLTSRPGPTGDCVAETRAALPDQSRGSVIEFVPGPVRLHKE